MNCNIALKGNSVYSWYSNNTTSVIGYFFNANNELFTKEEALTYIESQRKTLSLFEIAKQLNGIFTIVEQTENSVSIICDSVNYFPVFYSFQNNNWIIRDSWNEIISYKKSFEANTRAYSEFLSAGFVLDNETLDKTIFKTKSSELLQLETEGTITRKPYYYFLPTQFFKESFEGIHDATNVAFQNFGKRLIAYLNGRTAVVPLSGGYDSRLIVSVLKSLNYTNVICVTYGKMNKEVPISKRVAETLGYTWYFIDYEKLDISNFTKSQEFLDYASFSGNGFSMPYLQEFFAVKELKNQKLIPVDSVFLPGHSGDYLGGSYIEKTIKTDLSKAELPKHLESKYFIFKKKTRKDSTTIQNRIAHTLQAYDSNTGIEHFSPIIEDWDIKEKLSKYIFRSSNVFTYFGYEHYFPLWDKELVKFFRNVPYEYRIQKKLYDSVAERYYFSPQNIAFKKEELIVRKRDLIIQKAKDKVRYFFPWKIVLQRMIQADWMYYSVLTSEMQKEIEQTTKKPFKNFKFFNAVICKWYVCNVENL